MSFSSASGVPDEDRWFHENTSREEAEAILKEVGEDRAFLVRASASSVGDYAISVFSDNSVHHIHVKRHGEDAFFSIEGNEPCHGLDELIKHLQLPASPDEESVLETPVLKSLPPPDVRRHGRTNLLHRATKERSIVIVKEMLRMKNRSIDAKNDEGQTAAHLASMNGFPEILQLLIKTGTNVNAKDSFSCTPLHYACRNNHPEIVCMLLEEGKADPQIRRNDDSWVPMHEAASLGHLECVQLLYQHNAPLRPRTKDNDTPLHLALRNNHVTTVQFFDTIVVQNVTIHHRDEFYHNRLDRKEALEILRAYRRFRDVDPMAIVYLVRKHSNKDDAYVLTLATEEKPFNYEINQEGNFLYIDNGPYLESLEHLIQHYSSWPDGLPGRLQVPVSPEQAKAVLEQNLSSSRSSLDVPPPLPKRTPTSNSPLTLNRLCHDVENNNRPTSTFSKENIPFEALQIGELLGAGEFGEVHAGTLNTGSPPLIDVAIKTLKTEGEMNEWKKNEFRTEANTMMKLEHAHIVKIIGMCWSPKTYMIQELCKLGSLQDYLQDHSEQIIPTNHFRIWAHQIAKGMVYLQQRRFVHRDLAVRNILLSSVLEAKISDFGLSRALGLDSDYYTASHGGQWPIKWYAPESCSHGTFSHATDVWSYGITLWEIYSYGAGPYEEFSGKEAIEMVESGYRLEQPEQCPDQVYRIIRKCWSKEPELRPKFTFLENFFAESGDGETLTPTRTRRSSTSPLPPPPLPATPAPRRNLNESLNVLPSEVSLISFD